jgi:hypothetical protein
MAPPLVRRGSAAHGAVPWPGPWTTREEGARALRERHLDVQGRRARRCWWRRAVAASTERRPCRCDPGTMRSGPLSVVQLSRCTRKAVSVCSTATGGWTYRTPSFTHQPLHSGCGTRSWTGILRSWCSATSQFLSADLSKSVHCTATAPRGSKESSAAWLLRYVASLWQAAKSRTFREPARSERELSRAESNSTHSP